MPSSNFFRRKPRQAALAAVACLAVTLAGCTDAAGGGAGAADSAAGRPRGVTFTETRYDARREWKTFAATDGSFTEQTITHVGAGIEANAIEGDEHQRRSYPDAGGGFQAAGYEYIRGLDLVGSRRRVRRGAVEARPRTAVTTRGAGAAAENPRSGDLRISPICTSPVRQTEQR